MSELRVNNVSEVGGDAVIASGVLDSGSLPAGSVLQVVSTTKNDAFSTTSTSLVDVTGLSVSITPTAATSKILIFADVTIASSESGFFAGWQITDGSNTIVSPVASGADYIGANDFANVNALDRQMKHFLLSPATTSAITYKVRAVNFSGGGRSTFINRSPNNAQFAVSTITVMEIAG